MDIRTQFQERLTEYVEDTLGYIETVRDFCDHEQEWTSERNTELEKMRDINKDQQEKELNAVLTDTLMGLKKLEVFLKAVEMLTVTSRHVFSKQIFMLRGESPKSVQSVIIAAGIDAHLLIHFTRNAETFFRPILYNVNVLIFQLQNYIIKTQQLCKRMKEGLISQQAFRNMNKASVELILEVNDDTMKQMLQHLQQLSEIRKDQDIRLAFLFQENAQKFIHVFSERHSRMWRLLSDLNDTAANVHSLMKGTSISTVAGSSVGIVGGVLSLFGLAFPPLLVVGAVLGGFSVADTLVTEVTKSELNRSYEQKAKTYVDSYQDDMIKIVECLNEAANSERPLVQPSGVDVGSVVHGIEGVVEGSLKGIDVAVASAERRTVVATIENLENVQVATNLSRTGNLAKMLKFAKPASVVLNGLLIGVDGYYLVTESISLSNGSETEVSRLIRSRTALWKSELEVWKEMYDSLCIGVKTIKECQQTLEKPFLP